MSTLEYIDSFRTSAVQEMHGSGVPASITLAQGILESSSGNSRLAKHGNNHFGIKCKKSWTGKVMYEDDDALQECFRAYDNALESYKDHSNFLRRNRRYAFLFDLEITDYKGWAKGLQKAGYATNKKYASMLIALIERYELHQFDLETAEPSISEAKGTIVDDTEPKGKGAVKADKIKVEQVWSRLNPELPLLRVNKGEEGFAVRHEFRLPHYELEKIHVVKKGESLYGIAMKYGVTPTQLQKRNKLVNDEISVGQKLYYDQLDEHEYEEYGLSEETRPEEQQEENYVLVKEGDTLYSIAKKHKLSLEELKSKNQFETDELKVGQKVFLN